MSISRRTVTSILIIAFKAVCVIGVNRWMAMKFGPDGFAQYAHFLNALSLFLLIPSEGIGKAIVKYLADPGVEDKQRFIAAGWVLHVFALLISAALIYSFPSYFLSKAFPGLEQYSVLASIFLAVVYGHMITLYMQSVLLGLDHFKGYTAWQLVSALLPIMVVLCLSLDTQQDYILYLGGAAAVMAIPAHLLMLYWSGWKGLGKAFTDLVAGKIFMQWILMATMAVLSGKGIEFYMRSQSIEIYGAELTGLWQSVVRFSDYYMAAVYGLITMVFYPHLSTLVEDRVQFRKTFLQISALIMGVSVLGLCSVYFLKGFILDQFFSQDFSWAQRYFFWQLQGDAMRILAALCGMVLLVRARLMIYTLTQLVYGAATIFWLNFETIGQGEQYIQATAFAALVYGLLSVYLIRKEFEL